jgi:hypothetical protein
MHVQEGNKTLVWDVCMDTRVIKRIMGKRTCGAEWIHCSVGGFSECGDAPMGYMEAGNFLTGWRAIHNSRKSPYCTLQFLDFMNRYRSLPSSVKHDLCEWAFHIPCGFDNHLSSGIESRYAVRLFLLMCRWVLCPYGMALPQVLHGQDGLRWGHL